MVFEQIFKVKWLEQKPGITFLLGFIYAELGIISALLVFPETPSLISIGFISLLILPSLNSLLQLETNEDAKQHRISLKRLFKDHNDILQVYAYLFLGILLAYGIFAVALPEHTSLRVFETQLDIYTSNAGRASDLVGSAATGLAYTSSAQFWSILFNNLKVIMVCVIFSLVYGAGSILFLTWNASVWGAIFGFVAKKTAFGTSSFMNFMQIMIGVFPHMITEALAYFLAVFAGGIVSKAVLREKFDSPKFNHVFMDGLIIFGIALLILVLAAWLEVYVYPVLNI